MGKVEVLKYGDNYIYVVSLGSNALIVDPSNAKIVSDYLNQKQLKLTAILNTHNHFDHTAGNLELKQKTGCVIFGSDRNIPGIDKILSEKTISLFDDIPVKVLSTPGHTSCDVCFYLPNEKAVFTGDTIFTGGCGRVFGGDYESMWESLQKIAGLAQDTTIYCGHDYTEENYRFALSVLEKDEIIEKRLDDFNSGNIFTTIGEEKETNIFLRAKTLEKFIVFRKKKNYFN